MKFTGLFLYVLLISTSFILSACETTDDNNLEKARSCMDNAAKLAATDSATAATNATTCETTFNLISASTPESGRVGVGLILIEQQKLASLVSMAKSLQQPSNGFSSALGFLTFTTNQVGAPGIADASRLTTYATRSTSSGALKLSNLIYLSTLLGTYGGLQPNPTPAQAAAAITAIAMAGGANADAAAAAAVTAQQNACAGSGAGSSTCTKLTNAINGATTTQAILANMATFAGNGG